jgi:hypothetical protein
MSDRVLERHLRSLEAPEEGMAALRAWELASAEFERRELVAKPSARARRGFVLGFAAICLAAVGISPAGADVVRWVGDRLEAKPGVQHPKPFLRALPAKGNLLASTPTALWVVHADGSKRRLGRYTDAAWSPHGLFVAAVHGHELVAMEPGGRIHWTVTAATPPRAPSWAPSGYQIAYLSGRSVRLVAGDGTGDHLFAANVMPVAPAWRPTSGYVLAFASHGGVTVADAEHGITLWRTEGRRPLQLAWAPDGRELLVVEAQRLRLFDSRGRVRKELDLPPGVRAERAAFSPDGKQIALVRSYRLSDVRLLSVRGHSWHERSGAPVTGRFSGVDWSPDGRWLLVGWRDADQWLFVRGNQVRGVSNIARAFAPSGRAPAIFPTLGGWCCSR